MYHLLNSDYIIEGNGCGCSYFRGPDKKCYLHDHEFFEFVITVTDNVIHEVNGKKTKLDKNTLLLIRPFDVHRYLDEGQGRYDYVNMAFTAATFDEVTKYLNAESLMQKLADMAEPPKIMLTENQSQSIVNKVLRLMGGSILPEPMVYAKGVIAEIFSKYFLNNCIDNNVQEVPQWFAVLCNEMYRVENFSADFNKMCEITGMSYGYIGHCFKKYLNTTPTDYINNIRLNYTENMLLHTNMSILEIVFESGFNNVGHFYKLFKEKNGCSPNAYRKINKRRMII